MSLQLDPNDLRLSHRAAGRAPMPTEQSPPPVGRLRTAFVVLWARIAFSVGLLVGLVLAAATWQRIAPDEWRLSRLIGSFVGDTQAAQIAASLTEEKARTAALLEEQARMQKELIATQARAQEIVAAAQSQAQQEIQALQGRVQIAAAAYQTLYERSNQLAVLYAQTSQAFMQMRTHVAQGNQGGSTLVANVADLMKGVAMFTGDTALYQQADVVKRTTTESQMRELDAAMARAVPNIDARALIAQGLPNPAQLTAVVAFTPQAARPAPIQLGDRPPMPVSPYRKTVQAR